MSHVPSLVQAAARAVMAAQVHCSWGAGKPFHAYGLKALAAPSPAGKALA